MGFDGKQELVDSSSNIILSNVNLSDAVKTLHEEIFKIEITLE